MLKWKWSPQNRTIKTKKRKRTPGEEKKKTETHSFSYYESHKRICLKAVIYFIGLGCRLVRTLCLLIKSLSFYALCSVDLESLIVKPLWHLHFFYLIFRGKVFCTDITFKAMCIKVSLNRTWCIPICVSIFCRMIIFWWWLYTNWSICIAAYQ